MLEIQRFIVFFKFLKFKFQSFVFGVSFDSLRTELIFRFSTLDISFVDRMNDLFVFVMDQ